MIWSESTTIGIYYNRTRDWVFISGASYSMVVYDENYTDITSSIPSEAFVISEGVGVYLLDINSSYLSVAMYILEITFSRQYHEDGVITIFVDVQPIKAYAVPNVKSASVEYPENFTFKVWYYTESYNITDANATYTMEYGGVPIDTGNLTFNATDKSYELFISSRDAFNKSGASDLPITLTIYVHLSREYHESKTLILALTIEPIKTKLTLSEKSATLRYGQVWIFYMNYTDIDGVTPLYDADARYNISCNGTLIVNGTIPYDRTDSWYEFYLVFNTTEILNKTLEKIDIRLPVVYEIRVWFGKKFYEKQSAVLSVTVNPMETMLDVSATSVSIKYGESWLFNFSYIDIVSGSLITNATTYYEIRYGGTVLKNGSLLYSDEHNYYIVFNSTEIVNKSRKLGTYALYVYFRKRFYEVREKLISITVEPRDTYVEVNATSVTMEYGEVCVFEVRYIDMLTMSNITDANATFEIVFNETIVRRGSLTYDSVMEAYYLVFNSRDIINESWPYLGTYVVNVYLEKLFYVNLTKVLSVTVTKIKTIAYAQPEEINVTWGQAPEVLIYYIVAKNGSIIPMAIISVTSTPATDPAAFIVSYDSIRNVYVLNVNSSYLSVEAYYIVDIGFNKTFYEEKTVRIKVYVEPIDTVLSITPESTEVEYGDIVEFVANYYVYETGEVVSNAIANYTIKYREYNLSSGSFYFDGTRYILTVNTTELIAKLANVMDVDYIDLPVTITVDVTFSKSVYMSQSKTLAITIYDIGTTVELTANEITAEWGENVSVGIRIIRNKTLEMVRDVEISVIAPDMPNGSWSIAEVEDGYQLLVYTKMLEVVEVLNKSYLITLSFYKPYYEFPDRYITITVTKVSINVDFVGDIPSSVQKIQIIGEHKTTEIRVLVTHKGIPVEDAVVLINVSSVEAGKTKTYNASKTGVPGVFSITIDWADYPPGYTWRVVVSVRKVKVYGMWAPTDKVAIYPALIERKIRMDYLSGSTRIKIPGVGVVYIANMFYYPILIILFSLIAYGGYKFFSWYMLPWEVKEVMKILRMIEKGVFEYPAPDRREYLRELIAEELGAEIPRSEAE